MPHVQPRAARPAGALALTILLAALVAPTAAAGDGDLPTDVQEILDSADDDVVPLSQQAGQDVRDAVQEAGQGIGDALTEVEDTVRGVPDVTGPVVDGVHDTVADAAEAVDATVAELVGAIQGATAVLRDLNAHVGEVLDTALSAVQGYAARRLDAVAALTTAVLAPLPGVAEQATDAVTPPDPEGSPAEAVDAAAGYASGAAASAAAFATDTVDDTAATAEEILGSI